jgi:hypothetical protein
MKKNKNSGLEPPEYDSAVAVAIALYEQDCLDEPSVEALASRPLRIIIEEYAENPASLISYYKRKKRS